VEAFSRKHRREKVTEISWVAYIKLIKQAEDYLWLTSSHLSIKNAFLNASQSNTNNFLLK